MRIILDCETDGLLDNLTKIHCLSYYDIDTKISKSLTDYSEMRSLLLLDNITIIGHNIIVFDIPVFEKILEIKFKGRAVDTLPLSWYLYPERNNHGLADWGVDLGVLKPVVEDWLELNVHVYINRCEEDVKINTKLFDLMIAYLSVLYSTGFNKLLGYLTFKMNCAAEQEKMRWKLNVSMCKENLLLLQNQIVIRREALRLAMPPVQTFKIVERPKKFNRKDGTLSSLAEKWLVTLQSLGLPSHHIGAVKVVTGEIPGNPNSHTQLKAWLFSLGWVPQTFDYKRKVKHDYKSEIRAIPQISTKSDGICPSVKLLFDRDPGLFHLEGLFILIHRESILKGFLENKSDDDYLKAEISGLTNTLRFQHRQIVNLPTVFKPWGKEVRGVLTVPDDSYLLCGFDVSGLEDQAKRHYMFPYDPEYVKQMMDPNFDPHLDIALQGELVTQEEIDYYKWFSKQEENKQFVPLADQKVKFILISKQRKDGKTTNFGATYGAGPAKLALSSGKSLQLMQKLHKAYWLRNWAIKKIADNTQVKIVNNQMWLFNPVSELWYSLRATKDKFSTLNQGTGVYIFDTFIRRVRAKGIKLCGQFHDEGITYFKFELRDRVKEELLAAMEEANAELQLNVKLNISIHFGKNYADVH